MRDAALDGYWTDSNWERALGFIRPMEVKGRGAGWLETCASV